MKTIIYLLRSIGIILFLVGAQFCFSQQLSYKPINPAFGGDTFNYQWLLSSASAQNQFDDSDKNTIRNNSPISTFNDNVNRQILNQISRGLFGNDFGQGEMTPGVYNMGSLNISISEYTGGLNINIIDILTGEQTYINIPNT